MDRCWPEAAGCRALLPPPAEVLLVAAAGAQALAAAGGSAGAGPAQPLLRVRPPLQGGAAEAAAGGWAGAALAAPAAAAAPERGLPIWRRASRFGGGGHGARWLPLLPPARLINGQLRSTSSAAEELLLTPQHRLSAELADG
jgi:hypothetical protein